MKGFAGIVSYKRNFLYEINKWAAVASDMAEKAGGGSFDSVSLIEDCAVISLNSSREIKKNDYYKKTADEIYYLGAVGDKRLDRQSLMNRFIEGGAEALGTAEGLSSAVFYLVLEKKLLLFHGSERKESLFYWVDEDGLELFFCTRRNPMQPFIGAGRALAMEAGELIEFGREGLLFRKK